MVFVQSPHRSKGCSTDLAAEKTLAAVYPNMSFQVFSLYKVFTPSGAPKGPLVEMYPFVRPQMAGLSKAFSADFTFVWFVAGVYPAVRLQFRSAGELLFTDIAD